MRVIILFLALLLAGSAARGEGAPVGVTFVTDWKAQAEHGGFYQALAEGRYAARGLDVTIIQGGPSINIPQLMAAGSADFGMGSNSFIPLNLLEAGAPVKAVAAIFQKDPQVLITHPRGDVNSIADMKGKPVMVSDATIGAFWIWLRAKFGFTDDQIRKYTFNLAPFLTDETAIQQGYLSSEPYLIEKEGGFKPEVYLLSDEGYPGYACFILASQEMIATHPQIVAAFVDASIEGWMSYLYGDPSPGNALILRDNPEMAPDVLDQAIAKMRAFGIVDSGDTKTLGVGAMTDSRMKEFFALMSQNGVYRRDLPYTESYTLQFVNKGLGREMGPKTP